MQFDIYHNRNEASREQFPYLLDIQSELLDVLETRVVVPLAPERNIGPKRVTTLMPCIQISGKSYVAVTPQMAGIARRELGALAGNAAETRTELIASLDLLFTGI